MVQPKKSTTTISVKKPAGTDATTLLKMDHKIVDSLFKDYEATNSNNKKKQIVADICKELTIHAQIEEEIFYPAVKAALNDHELVPEAIVEHASLKELIAAIKDIEPDGEMYDAKVKVLGEYVKHHVKEEEKEMFPDAKDTKLDMTELGAQMLARKQQLSDEYSKQ